MFKTLSQDLQSVLERDPAARSKLEVFLCYPGLHALWSHRVASWLWKRRLRLLARLISQTSRSITGIEIHPGATLGPRFFIDHGMGVVIGETAVVGADVTIYHGVTLGGTSLDKGTKRHPTLEDGVIVGSGAKVLGNIVIGARSRIGANAVVVKTVPPEAVVVGVPGQVLSQNRKAAKDAMPDAIGETLISLMERVANLEDQPGAPHLEKSHPKAPQHGVWSGEDFSI